MTHRKHAEPSRHGWQLATAALVLLASVAWACHASAADAPGRVGAGSVSALAIDPHTGATLYAATVCGGVLKSGDGGGTWIVANTGLTTKTVEALAIDPTTPSTLYAGIGDFGTGGGVFKSTDGGATWSRTGLHTYVVALAIDPATPSTLYAATYNLGLFKSTNSGGRWEAVNTSLIVSFSHALAIDPTTPSTLYAGTSGGVFKSTDGASTWSAVNTTGLTDTYVVALAIDPATPSTLYAATYYIGLFKSTDSGGRWEAANTSLIVSSFHALAIDPTTPSTLYAGTNGGVFKSTDGAGTWGTTSLRGLAICGDGLRCGGEVCDDGNLVDGDGCDSNCTPTACGNGIVTPSEQCDDGNLFDGDKCDWNCTVARHDVCGNRIIDAGEECDDGGLCIGGADAGTFCTTDAQCEGGACTAFGGDGCAANCTTETEVPFNLVPGVVPQDALEFVPGTSGQVLRSDFIWIPLPFGAACNGGDNPSYSCVTDSDCPGGTCVPSQEILTIGKERDGQIPVVIKAAAVPLARMNVGNAFCLCLRAVAAKTCGGTMFEPDGATLSLDCTPGFTAGDSVCAGKPPCTYVHGPGNSAAGVIGCDGLDGVNVSLTQDSGGASGTARPPLLTINGSGAQGSAVLFAHTATNGISYEDFRGFSPLCWGQDPSVYGADGEFCTDDDPQIQRGSVSSGLVTTGTASAAVLNANGADGVNLPGDGPLTATGHPFNCRLLADGSAAGAALASVAVTVHQDTIGDSVTTNLLATAPPPACVGDCHGDGEVTIDELLTLVNLALGTAQSPACPDGVPSGAGVDVALIIQAVNHALDGCGG